MSPVGIRVSTPSPPAVSTLADLVAFFADNLYARGTVTLTADASFPKANLYDGDRSTTWRAPGAGSYDVPVDVLGATGAAGRASAWALVNHNVPAGGLVGVYTRPDSGSSWTLVDSVAITSDPFIRSLGQEIEAAQWMINLPNIGTPLQVGELLLGIPHTLPPPSFARAREARQGNVRRSESPGGYGWKVRRGPAKERRVYGWSALGDDDWTTLRDLFDALDDGAGAFLFQDAAGLCFWAELENPEIAADLDSLVLLNRGIELAVREAL